MGPQQQACLLAAAIISIANGLRIVPGDNCGTNVEIKTYTRGEKYSECLMVPDGQAFRSAMRERFAGESIELQV